MEATEPDEERAVRRIYLDRIECFNPLTSHVWAYKHWPLKWRTAMKQWSQSLSLAVDGTTRLVFPQPHPDPHPRLRSRRDLIHYQIEYLYVRVSECPPPRLDTHLATSSLAVPLTTSSTTSSSEQKEEAISPLQQWDTPKVPDWYDQVMLKSPPSSYQREEKKKQTQRRDRSRGRRARRGRPGVLAVSSTLQFPPFTLFCSFLDQLIVHLFGERAVLWLATFKDCNFAYFFPHSTWKAHYAQCLQQQLLNTARGSWGLVKSRPPQRQSRSPLFPSLQTPFVVQPAKSDKRRDFLTELRFWDALNICSRLLTGVNASSSSQGRHYDQGKRGLGRWRSTNNVTTASSSSKGIHSLRLSEGIVRSLLSHDSWIPYGAFDVLTCHLNVPALQKAIKNRSPSAYPDDIFAYLERVCGRVEDQSVPKPALDDDITVNLDPSGDCWITCGSRVLQRWSNESLTTTLPRMTIDSLAHWDDEDEEGQQCMMFLIQLTQLTAELVAQKTHWYHEPKLTDLETRFLCVDKIATSLTRHLPNVMVELVQHYTTCTTLAQLVDESKASGRASSFGLWTLIDC